MKYKMNICCDEMEEELGAPDNGVMNDGFNTYITYSNDKDKGKKFNRLCNNNWCRDKLVNNLNKWCNIYGVKLIKVKPEYSSFLGNLVYRSLRLPDMILSSIEISRRGFEFYHQYILKDHYTI